MLSDSNILLSCYFNSKPDPQAGSTVAVSPNKIATWHNSARAVGIKNIVLFHDGLPGAKEISDAYKDLFMPYEDLNSVYPRNMSLNDVRFFVYLLYLAVQSNIDYVLCTDAFDVEFYENPFHYMDRDKLYIGSNDKWIDKPRQCPRLRQLARNADIGTYLESPLLNPGILGGEYGIVIDFIRDMLPRLGEQFNNNMPLVNVIGYSDKWRDKIVTGKPLHTVFKQYEKRAGAGAWIRHK